MGYVFNPTTGKLDTVRDPAGSDTQLQFNDGGSFNGSANLTYAKASSLLTNKGDINLDDGGSFTTTLQCITPTAARTISLPDATGTVALVAGSSGQLIWNSSGAYAGASTLTYDGSILTTSGRFINSYNATASSPAKAWTGTWFTGGTATTTKPHVLIEPTGATSTAWSTSGTAIGVNAASGFAGNLLDLQVNAARRFAVAGTGLVTVTGGFADQVGFSFNNTTSNAGYSSGLEILSPNMASNETQTTLRFGRNVATNNAGYLSFKYASSGSTSNAISFALHGASEYYFTSGGLIQIGGTTSSFPAIKRSSAIVQARLADDSGYTTIDAQHRLQGTAPASATAAGTAGDVRYDGSYIYVCTATNTWVRAALSTW